MRIERRRAARAKNESDLQSTIDAVDLHAKRIARLQLMNARKLLRNRDRIRLRQPSLNIELARFEIRQLKSAEWSVRKNIDPEDQEIFARQIRQRDNPAHQRRGGGDSGWPRHDGKNRFGNPATDPVITSSAFPATTSMVAANARFALWFAI